MKHLIIQFAVMVSIVLATPAVFAADSTITDIAKIYSGANWMLSDTTGRPYPPTSGVNKEISSAYLDANWALLNIKGKSHPATKIIQADCVITLARGED